MKLIFWFSFSSTRRAERGASGHDVDQPGHHADEWRGAGSPSAEWNPQQFGPGAGGDVTSPGVYCEPACNVACFRF